MLIVDDDEDMRFLVRLRLELAGDIDVVAVAVDGLEALDAFERLGAPPIPHVVVLDNRMPNMTGLEVGAELLTRVPGQRIILFTAYADQGTIDEALRLGISEVVSKSDVEDLPAVVRRLHSV